MDKVVTLCENRDFRRAYAKGMSYVSPVLITYVIKNRYLGKRLGITTSKKIGNAVNRNRARRVIKQAFREVYPFLSKRHDFVFVARSKTSSKSRIQNSQVNNIPFQKIVGVNSFSFRKES